MEIKGLLIPVITAILGSSVISTIAINSYNEIINTMKQPTFNIKTDYDILSFKTYSKPISLNIHIQNVGNGMGIKPLITFDLSESINEIKNITIIPSYLEGKIIKDPHNHDTFYLNLSIINIGQIIKVNVLGYAFTDDKFTTFLPPLHSAAFGEGSRYIDTISINHQQGFKNYPDDVLLNHISNFTLLLFGPIIIVFIIILTIYIYNKYVSKETVLKRENNLDLMVKLRTLLLKINTELSHELNSLQIFDYEFWVRTNNDIRKNLFDKYDNFNIITQLFLTLKQREYECLKVKIDSTKLIDYNRKCLSFVQKALDRIEWNKYIYSNISLLPIIFIIFPFSIISLVISSLEYIWLVAALSLTRYDPSVVGMFIAGSYIMLIIPTRFVAYQLLFKVTVKKIMTKSLDRDYELIRINQILMKKRKIINLTSLFLGIPSSIIFIAIMMPFAINGDPFYIPYYHNNVLSAILPAYYYIILFPWLVIFDIVRINLISIPLLKRKIIRELISKEEEKEFKILSNKQIIKSTASYFFGILIIFLGILWILSTIPISSILMGSIGLMIVIGGFSIIYWYYRSVKIKKHELNNNQNIRHLLSVRLQSKIAYYFYGILAVSFGILWILSTIPIPVILIGSIGLMIVIGGFSIIYWEYRSVKILKTISPIR